MLTVLHGFLMRFVALFVSIASLFGFSISTGTGTEDASTEYMNVFVNGYMGWGSYDWYYDILAYWGFLGGDAMFEIDLDGYNVVYASCSGMDSTWDRCCELYAQLTGTVVDYGEAHSAKYNHDRYGEDYTGKGLLEDYDWSEENKINLYGHSFGGATVRLLASLLEYGSEEEVAATGDDTSELFTGGHFGLIYSITTLSSPHNGTSAYEAVMYTEEGDFFYLYNCYLDYTVWVFDIITGLQSNGDGTYMEDTASYDMQIDNAMALNETIYTCEDIYYFSYATCATVEDEDTGYQVPSSIFSIENLFYTRSLAMGKTSYTTAAGYEVDEKWWANDGLVNTYSALAPIGAPQTEYSDDIELTTGIWYIMPVVEGDHTYYMGDLLLTKDAVSILEEVIDFINLI